MKDMKIVPVPTVEYRPCTVRISKTERRKALFHRWADSAQPFTAVLRGTESGQIWQVHGIVEFEDGTIREVWPHEITFCDNLHHDYAWSNINAGEGPQEGAK